MAKLIKIKIKLMLFHIQSTDKEVIDYLYYKKAQAPLFLCIHKIKFLCSRFKTALIVLN